MATNIRTKKTELAIQKAMVKLLRKKSFDEITTTELARTAKLSRQGFYIHYQDKYDMIQTYQEERFQHLENELSHQTSDTLAETLEKVFEFLKKDDLFAALILENGSREIHIFLRNKLKLLIDRRLTTLAERKLTSIEEKYSAIYLSYAFFGIYQTWIATGKKETPREMADYIMSEFIQ